MSNLIAFVFPGQGSQAVGMGKELCDAFPTARRTFEEADHILGFPISRLMWDGPEMDLNDTINTQPALMVHSIAAWRVLTELRPGLTPTFAAGHSMGELSALAAAGALSFPDALQLVRTRGVLMKRAGQQNPGGMAAIMGLDIPTLDQLCAQASTPDQIVQVANDNCPGQVVISGAKTALERALPLAQAAGARRAIPLAVSIAAHSPLMVSAQADFNRAVEAASLTTARIPVVGNVTARPIQSADDLRHDLQQQLTQRVRWTESVQYMIDQGVQSFIELGSGSVLSGLIRRINKDAAVFQFGKPEDTALSITV